MKCRTLSIHVPTFNRNNYLIDCVDSLINSIEFFKKYYPEIQLNKFIKIKIFDNNNSNKLMYIIASRMNAYDVIKYHHNGSNIGSDRNIAKCYSECDSDYCHVLGDDDVVSQEYLVEIYRAINNAKDFGLIYLNAYSYKYNKFKLPNLHILSRKILSGDKFINKINIRLTFISSIVVRNDYNRADFEQYIDSCFIQLVPFLQIINKYSEFLILKKFLIQAKANNNHVTNINDDVSRNIPVVQNDLIGIYCNSFFRILEKHKIYLENKVKEIIFCRFFLYEINIRKMNVKNFINNIDIKSTFLDCYSYKILSRIENEKLLKTVAFCMYVSSRLMSDELLKIIYSYFYQSITSKSYFIRNLFSKFISKLLTILGYKYTISVFYSGNGQVIQANSQTLIEFNTIEFGNINFNALPYPVIKFSIFTPEYAFRPDIKGYYHIITQVQLDSDGGRSSCDVFKNGSFYKRGVLGSIQDPFTSCIVFLNGVNDYIQIYVYSSIENKTQSTNRAQTYFQAYRI